MNTQIQPQLLEGGKMLTGEFTGSFIHVFQPHQFGNNTPEYSVEMLFDPADPTIQVMAQMIQKAATEKWGANIPGNLRSPIRDGNTKAAKYPEMGGKYYVKASTKTRKPLVIDRNKAEVMDPAVIYSGAKYRAIISTYAYSNSGNNGVGFGLEILQKTQDGTPLAGSVPDPSIMPDLAPLPQTAQTAPQGVPGQPGTTMPGMPQTGNQEAPAGQPVGMPTQGTQMVPQGVPGQPAGVMPGQPQQGVIGRGTVDLNKF